MRSEVEQGSIYTPSELLPEQRELNSMTYIIGMPRDITHPSPITSAGYYKAAVVRPR